MKKILITWIAALGIFPVLGSDAVPGVIYQENLDPFAARNLCGQETHSQFFDLEAWHLPCPSNSARLYYHFMTSAGGTLEIGTLTTVVNCDYSIYGPFASLPEGAQLINQDMAPEVVSSGGGATTHTLEIDSQKGAVYILEVTYYACGGSLDFALEPENMTCSPALGCEDCLPAFSPGARKYVLSAWVKEEGAAPTKTSYDQPSIELTFPGPVTFTFNPSGQIIDGWQRIESIFESPGGSMTLKLQVASGNAFFDDIRIFPFDGSMISYVYDPVTLRLVAELDERNYAKIYEYDEEGKLTRIKKETEKGIMTIQENRENSVKKP